MSTGNVQMSSSTKLVFFCGKMAAGKSTLARDLADRARTILLVQDELLGTLFPGQIIDVMDYLECSTRLQQALAPHVCALLSNGISVVLDFPGNTRGQRAWFRTLIERAMVDHELHFIDAPDDLCKRQLRERSKGLAAGTPWTTDADFDAITVFFQAPSEDEGFNVIRHERV
jgi:predicted kinase